MEQKEAKEERGEGEIREGRGGGETKGGDKKAGLKREREIDTFINKQEKQTKRERYIH